MRTAMLRKLRRLLAYLLVRFLVSLAEVLPRRIGLRLYAGLGLSAFSLARRSRAVAMANLRLVYGGRLSDGEIHSIARAAFANMGRFAYDAARVKRQTPGSLAKLVTLKGRHHLDEALARGKGVIGLTGHVGNWELLAAYFSRAGYAVNVVAATLRDSNLNDVLVGIRRSAGMSVIERSKGLKEVVRCLRRGEILGVLIDQDTSVESVVVDFLGAPAKTAVGPVRLASTTGAAIVPMAMLMNERGGYDIEVREPFWIDGNGSSLEDDVERCSKAVESFIREQPSQWVWMHKRWKSVRSEMYA